MSLVPPKAAATRGIVPTVGHVGEDGFGHVQIVRAARQIVSSNPGSCPPAFIIIVIIQEIAALAGQIKVECVLERRNIVRIIIGDNVVLNGFHTIGRMPPAGGVPQTVALIPALEGGNGGGGVGVEIIAGYHRSATAYGGGCQYQD